MYCGAIVENQGITVGDYCSTIKRLWSLKQTKLRPNEPYTKLGAIKKNVKSANVCIGRLSKPYAIIHA